MSKHISLSGLKILLEPLIHLIDKKAECPDWNENDPKSLSYIKDRTHWEEHENIVDNITVSLTPDPYGDCYCYFEDINTVIVPEQIYHVIFNDVEYTCKAWTYTFSDDFTCICIGNGEFFYSLEGMGGAEPFLFDFTDGLFMCAKTPGAYTFSIIESVIHKIDAKYLPEISNVGKEGSAKGAEIFNHYEDENEYGYVFPANVASGDYSHAEGYVTVASGECSHAEGTYTEASNFTSHAEGSNTIAEGYCSHSEGCDTRASGMTSHAEGRANAAGGDYSHVEGWGTQTYGTASHTEGYNTTADGDYSHAEGYQTFANGDNSHTEGEGTKAETKNLHVIGAYNFVDSEELKYELITSTFQNMRTSRGPVYVFLNDEINFNESTGLITCTGGYKSVSTLKNVSLKQIFTFDQTDSIKEYYILSNVTGNYARGTYVKSVHYNQRNGKYIQVVGNGTSTLNRSNAHTLDWSGNAWFAGDVYVGGTNQDNGEKLLKFSELPNNNIINGTNKGSLRTTGTAVESDSYKLGEYAFSEGYSTWAFGDCSHAEGYCTHAKTKSLNVIGEYNLVDEELVYTIEELPPSGFSSNALEKVYKLTGTQNFDSMTGSFTFENATQIPYPQGYLNKGDLFTFDEPSKITEYYRYAYQSNAGYVCDRYVVTPWTKRRGRYIHVAGNGTSSAKSSNAHTLDWQGNAWYSGDVYVGSTSGTNKDEGSKKLATEDFVNAANTAITFDRIDEICNAELDI